MLLLSRLVHIICDIGFDLLRMLLLLFLHVLLSLPISLLTSRPTHAIAWRKDAFMTMLEAALTGATKHDSTSRFAPMTDVARSS